ncbi:MAG: M23 family metallopeptidase [Coriobacteriia bacterium]|nr:M23 family metallopeptidase [Coriobacteriia bacterium]
MSNRYAVFKQAESVAKHKPGILQDMRFLPLLLLALFLVAVCALGISVPSAAAQTQSLPADIRILLGFRETYGPDNRQHLGIDVYAPRGSELYAPVDGTISFLGRVPGSAGLNVMALTIRTESGDLVSINPFLTTSIVAGQTVRRGQALGTVSDVGDPSSPESHFHLSLRVNGVYRDPTHLLAQTAGVVGGATQAPAATPPTPATATGLAATPVPAATPAAATVPATAPAAATALATQPQTAGSAAGSHLIAPVSAAASIAMAKSAAMAASLAAGDGLVQSSAAQASSVSSVSQAAPAANGQTLPTAVAAQQGLWATALSRVGELSQLQLMASLFAAGALLSCAGLGAWRSVQLMGLDMSARCFKDRLVASAKSLGQSSGRTAEN